MENNFDTICAISTPIAVGAIGIIRVSGDRAFEIVSKIFSKSLKIGRINYGHITHEGKILDEVIVLPFKAPKSYTGEDVVEIQSHGNPTILNSILQLVISCDARPAQRGEFTKRAFLNHRIDLSQAEAIMDIINSKSSKSAENALNNLGGYLKNKIDEIKNSLTELYSKLIASIDFPEDVAELDDKYIVTICNDNIQKIDNILENSKSHDFIRDGINACLIGRPNVGKSSLFNSLLNYTRAIVTPIEGTTRDTIKETINLDGYLVNFIDTAGIRDKDKADTVEQIGIEQSIKAINTSQIVMFLFEKSKTEIDKNLVELAKDKNILYIQTKADILSDTENSCDTIVTSSKTAFGIDVLKNKLKEIITALIPDDTDYTTNLRQQNCLIKAKQSLLNLIETSKSDSNPDLFSYDLKLALLSLGEITGEILTDNILNNIFDSFCIGK